MNITLQFSIQENKRNFGLIQYESLLHQLGERFILKRLNISNLYNVKAILLVSKMQNKVVDRLLFYDGCTTLHAILFLELYYVTKFEA